MEIILKLIESSVSGGFWRFVGMFMMVFSIILAPVTLVLKGFLKFVHFLNKDSIRVNERRNDK
jgi:hypothetical protein